MGVCVRVCMCMYVCVCEREREREKETERERESGCMRVYVLCVLGRGFLLSHLCA